MRTRRRLAGLVAVASVSLLVVSACTAKATAAKLFADCAAKPNECNGAKTKPGGTLTFSIEKKIKGWNVNAAGSNSFDTGEVMGGVLPQPIVVWPDFTVAVNLDLLVSATQTGANPQTIVYKINPAAVWDDGEPISADDFVYLWQTQNGRDCAACKAATSAGYEQIKSVTGADGGKTVTVVYETPFTDWLGNFQKMYPSHLAKQHGNLAASFAWFNETVPTWSGGPYKISEYAKDSSVTLVPNPRWYGRYKPSLDKVVFRIVDDQNAEVTGLRNNELQAVYTQAPNLDMVNQVKTLPGIQYALGRGLTWEHLDLNLSNKFLVDGKLRKAIFTAVNRQDVINKTVGQFAPGLRPLNSHNFVPGQRGFKDVITPTGQGAGDVTRAKKILTDGGYKLDGTTLTTPSGEVVKLRIAYSDGNVMRKATAEIFQSQLAAIGIKVEIDAVQLGDIFDSGDWDMVIFAWSGQPFPYAGAQQTWQSSSGSNFGHWTNTASDVLLKEAGSQTDPDKAIDALNEADQIMANDAYVLPLFQKPVLLAVQQQYANIRINSTQAGPPYDIAEWGIRES